MRRNTPLNKDFSRHDAFLLHAPPCWESRAALANTGQHRPLPWLCEPWGPLTGATEASCPSTRCNTPLTAPGLHPAWTPAAGHACGLGESRGRHFVRSALQGDKRPPSLRNITLGQAAPGFSREHHFTATRLRQPHVTGQKQQLW